MCAAELVAILRIVKIGSPSIMAQYRVTKPVLKVGCCRFESTGFGHGQYRKFLCLIGPDPVFVSVYFGACLVAADYRTVGNCLFELPVNRSGFLGKPADDIVYASLTQINPIAVF